LGPIYYDEIFIPPISVCFTFGFSSWKMHILRRSASVKVRRGVEVDCVGLLTVGGKADAAASCGGAGAIACGIGGYCWLLVTGGGAGGGIVCPH
jgi:hypothetical protein